MVTTRRAAARVLERQEEDHLDVDGLDGMTRAMSVYALFNEVLTTITIDFFYKKEINSTTLRVLRTSHNGVTAPYQCPPEPVASQLYRTVLTRDIPMMHYLDRPRKRTTALHSQAKIHVSLMLNMQL